jgi:shikimate dehydrogenase
VTVPHKQAVAACCDRLAPSAAAVGAVNCLEIAGRVVIGHNTDAAGFVDGLRAAAPPPAAGQRAVVLGAGGAARAVVAGLAGCGASVEIVARSPGRAAWAAVPVRGWDELAAALAGCDLLVDCTSAELAGAACPPTWPESVPLERLPATATVASLIYHREPALLAAARARGLRAVDGAGMLVHQAARAFSLWTGRPAPVEVMWAALRRARGG